MTEASDFTPRKYGILCGHLLDLGYLPVTLPHHLRHPVHGFVQNRADMPGVHRDPCVVWSWEEPRGL